MLTFSMILINLKFFLGEIFFSFDYCQRLMVLTISMMVLINLNLFLGETFAKVAHYNCKLLSVDEAITVLSMNNEKVGLAFDRTIAM